MDIKELRKNYYCLIFVTFCFMYLFTKTINLLYLLKKFIKCKKDIKSNIFYIITFVCSLISLISQLTAILGIITDINCNIWKDLCITAIIYSNCLSLTFLLLKIKIFINEKYKKWIYFLITFIQIIYITFIFINIFTPQETTRINEICVAFVDPYLIFSKIIIDICINMLFSIYFLFIVFKKRNTLYRTLIENGIFYCVIIVFSNIIITILIYYNVLGIYTVNLYCLDVTLIVILMVIQLKK